MAVPPDRRGRPSAKPESEAEKSNTVLLTTTIGVLLLYGFIALYPQLNLTTLTNALFADQLDTTEQCEQSCQLEIVESVPQNLSVHLFRVKSTYAAWHELISQASKSLDLAAYKSSLRGKHVLGRGERGFSLEGDLLFEELRQAGLERNVNIRIVENAPSKDKGDNEDAMSLQKSGVAALRKLNLQKIYNSGTMHSKFIVADDESFYMGSANLDWRSLSQKMELGVLVKNCPCLAKEMKHAFEMYWNAAKAETHEQIKKMVAKVGPRIYNKERPLKVQYSGVPSEVYLATSPKMMNAPERTWDLDAIVDEIRQAKTHVHIHVMDYFPMFLYTATNDFWPTIDNALRAAVMRGVDVKVIAAALHYPQKGLRFLKSLELVNDVGKGRVQVKIIKIPTPGHMQSVIRRERRTHKKFVVTDTSVIVGTSNWSGDYFEGVGTGVAIVIRQNGTEQPLVDTMRGIFERDWESEAAHDLHDYYDGCIAKSKEVDFCEYEKDKSLLMNN